MPETTVAKVRSEEHIAAIRDLVWEFFDFLRDRYPDMLAEIDSYIEEQHVAKDLQDFATVFLPPRGECFLARHRDKPVGMVMLKPRSDGAGEMNRMYVRAEARGLGLGRALGQAIVDEARALGYPALWLSALYRHVEAIPLYESLGFVRSADPLQRRSDDARVVTMKLDLR